ncbi:MAG: parB-like partition protein, partial [Acidobacteria bacterium]|nr:parB-like partition protein [Acidobacteriota bacterium]
MSRWGKLFGMGGTVKELDVRELAPVGSETLVREVPVADIHTNPFQPRRWFREGPLAELAASVKEYGVLQPLLVRLDGHDRYELIAGERRLRASRLAGMATVPVIQVEMSDQEVAEVGLIENLQREDLHFLEEAESFKQLMGFFGLTIEKLAERMGKSASTVSARLRLLKLEPRVRDAVVEAEITEKHARALLKLEDSEAQLQVIRKIAEQNLTARETEQWVNLTVADMQERRQDKPKPREKTLNNVRDVR